MPETRTISSALAIIAVEELNEVPNRVRGDLDSLKEWLNKTPYLKARTDDQFLLSFLRGCKHSLEKVKQKLEAFYTSKSLIPELLMNRDPTDDHLLSLIRLGFILPLPFTQEADSPRIVLIRPGVYDASVYKVDDVLKVTTMIQDILINEDDNLVIAGQVGVLDLQNVTISHLFQFTPGFFKKISVVNQDASPLRQKGFHYINTPVGFDRVFNIFKSFITEKNKQRLYVHKNSLESLYQYVPKHLLPKEYGGEAGPLQSIIDVWETKIISYRDYFKEDEKYGIDELKRPKYGNSKSLLEGSFRQLNVD